MSIILVVYDVEKIPSSENEDILHYLGYFPELAGREFSAPPPVYGVLGNDGDFLRGLLIRVNDATIHSDRLNMVVRYGYPDDEFTKTRMEKLMAEQLEKVLGYWFAMMEIEKPPEQFSFDGATSWSVDGNINKVHDFINRNIRRKFKPV